MLEACEDHAVKELIAEQLADAMDEQAAPQGRRNFALDCPQRQCRRGGFRGL
jgi:hypothetical protein